LKRHNLLLKLSSRITLSTRTSRRTSRYLYRYVMKKDVEKADSASESSMSTSHVGRLHDAGTMYVEPRPISQFSENLGQIALQPRNWRLLKRRTCIACVRRQPFMILPQLRVSKHQTPSHHPLSCNLTIQVTIAAPFRSRLWPSLQILPFRCIALFCRSVFQSCELAISGAY
jgi:hypothetical protein